MTVFRQFIDEDLGCASYLVGDAAAGEAVVVDPAFAIEPYLEAAGDAGLRIARVLETHTHADHLSGHGRFALEHGLPVAIHPAAGPGYPFDPLADGDVVQVGAAAVAVLHTPGHRPEHCAFVVGGSLVLSGDSLFVGDAARPDLAIEARAGATDLFRSLQRLSALPDGLALYPGHVAGSLCGAHMSPDHSSTIGRERATNHALLGNDLTSFVEESASLSTPRPPTTERLVELNRGPWVAARAPLGPVRPPDGTLVLDVRPIAAFAARHTQGAISVALDGGSFATRSAFVIGVDEPFVVRADSAEQAHEAQRLLDAVGLAGALGFLTEDGTAARLPTMTVAELAQAAALETLQIIDVREEGERTRTLPGSTAIPYRELRRTVHAELDRGRPVVAICESGQRAMLAASLLVRAGYDARAVVGGGVGDLLRNGAGGRFDVM